MAEFKGLVDRIVREEDGQGMIEYALIAALISVALIGVLGVVAGSDNSSGIGKAFKGVTDALGGSGT